MLLGLHLINQEWSHVFGRFSVLAELCSFLGEILGDLSVTLAMLLLNLLGVPQKNLGLHVDRHVAQNDVESLAQRFVQAEDFSECLKYLLLLSEVSSFVEISEQDCQEKVEHDDVSEAHQRHIIGSTDAAYRSHGHVHDVVPALTEHDLKDRESGVVDAVEVLSWSVGLRLFTSCTRSDCYIQFITFVIELDGFPGDRMILVWLLVIVEPQVTGEETLTDEGEHVDEESQQNDVVTDGGDCERDGVDEDSQIADFEQSEDFE